MIWDKLTSGQIEALDKNIPVLLNIAATCRCRPTG